MGGDVLNKALFWQTGGAFLHQELSILYQKASTYLVQMRCLLMPLAVKAILCIKSFWEATG